ncbi:uncharacterized protein CLUP02_05704 [Colletotrichum lupini]|uniref:Uncharacterized protein n=1 Tax=Colletotrichum lupini TaxID=145971 RepID=A0A9Q8SPJ4_9PEZI|nr:uncharacterized protein CLUP02_05704 [Colletotrichum lupini]UQC80222.1 hypothetical protein CLUP02_05704 [Colletotrichum lupini]
MTWQQIYVVATCSPGPRYLRYSVSSKWHLYARLTSDRQDDPYDPRYVSLYCQKRLNQELGFAVPPVEPSLSGGCERCLTAARSCLPIGVVPSSELNVTETPVASVIISTSKGRSKKALMKPKARQNVLGNSKTVRSMAWRLQLRRVEVVGETANRISTPRIGLIGSLRFQPTRSGHGQDGFFYFEYEEQDIISTFIAQLVPFLRAFFLPFCIKSTPFRRQVLNMNAINKLVENMGI